MKQYYGYAGQLLRVNLSGQKFELIREDEESLRKYLGGVGIGAKVLYEEVPPGTPWHAPDNRVILASGPFGGTRVNGSGTFCAVTKGALTDGATSTQANGYFGAFLKFAGFDGIIIEGRAKAPCYLYVHDGEAELRDGQNLVGKDTRETEALIRQELGASTHSASVFCIGPAGEKLVRFAALVGDRGHVAAHNGLGAVMGSKNLKAVAVARGKGSVRVYQEEKLSALTREMMAVIKNVPAWANVYHNGMLWVLVPNAHNGRTPFKNYTTNVCQMNHEQLATFSPEYLKQRFRLTPNPCWACQMHHCHQIRVLEGEYAGYDGEEPEYEGYAAMGPLIGIYDGIVSTVLSNEVDRLGLDVNETGWILGMVMECYEKGILTKEDTDGLEMTWGNVEAVSSMIARIAHRQGFGDVLAEGAMRAAERIGKEAPLLAIHSKRGNTPRTHDHRRGRGWVDLFDTCVSNTGTLEADIYFPPGEAGLSELSVPYSHKEIATYLGRIHGYNQFVDSLGVCNFTNKHLPRLQLDMLHAVTGWDVTREEALRIGRRAVTLLRAFNIRSGYTIDEEAPSARYGSALPDGPEKGRDIAAVWNEMLDIYYSEVGWDRATGKPLPETLKALDLASIIPDVWAEKE